MKFARENEYNDYYQNKFNDEEAYNNEMFAIMAEYSCTFEQAEKIKEFGPESYLEDLMEDE